MLVRSHTHKKRVYPLEKQLDYRSLSFFLCFSLSCPTLLSFLSLSLSLSSSAQFCKLHKEQIFLLSPDNERAQSASQRSSFGSRTSRERQKARALNEQTHFALCLLPLPPIGAESSRFQAQKIRFKPLSSSPKLSWWLLACLLSARQTNPANHSTAIGLILSFFLSLSLSFHFSFFSNFLSLAHRAPVIDLCTKPRAHLMTSSPSRVHSPRLRIPSPMRPIKAH